MNIFDKTARILIELSNICNYSRFHKRCPLYELKNKKEILSEKIVYNVFEICKKYNYSGIIGYHTYNEPGIDPRLMMFIKDSKKILPNIKILISTNGFYLDQTLIEEYEKYGVDQFEITCYSQEEYKKFKREIKFNIPVKLFNRYDNLLDKRLNIYSREINSKYYCYELFDLIVTYKGDISLCCFDWKRTKLFGNLYKKSLEDIMMSNEFLQTRERLSKGDRFFEVCKKCNNKRRLEIWEKLRKEEAYKK